ncbi:acetolactate synthase large subunit [Stella humosa]|uniref:Acetolactate synthase large subunit n=1 Tax=Stella humosa TaxID=94 RepID=A0A3N1M8T3_9PROT|nr:thiamine pyrophosphate-binding protein [Stella humosa]ROQ00123.1 acetolactate synthase large subunit [Stella humosa]BBK30643.1 thiamine pyrophosphate protein [Stella humosa]
MTRANARTGGQLLVDTLKVNGVDTVFQVAGESFLAVLDALYDARDDIRCITCRQEGGAAFMAEAYGKLTGKPGVLLVTRGPGACNASIGVHTAHQDSTPMVVLIGQVARDQAEREAFQEVDFRRMYGQLAKWVGQIESADRVPEYVSRAFHIATSGRPGPVVLALPEDMLRDLSEATVPGPHRPAKAHPGPDDMARLRAMLAAAKRPLLLVGGGDWTDRSGAAIQAWAEANGVPTACSFRRFDVVDNQSPIYVGDLGTGAAKDLTKLTKDADLLIAVGARLGEITTQGYDLLDSPEPRQTLIHVHPSAEELGRVFRPTLGIQSGVEGFAAAVSALPPVDGSAWAGWLKGARAAYEGQLTPGAYGGPMHVGEAMVALRAMLPRDAIIATDAGNASGWPQRFLQFGRPGRFLGPTSGAMGYAVPAAVAAAITHPGRRVVGFAGDGAFMMSGQEIATAIQYGATPIIVILNNNMYGTIRMHQERDFPARVHGTQLTNPDFAALARAYGAHGETVERTADFAPAFQRACDSGKLAVIEVKTDPDLITTRTTLTALREGALAKQ